MSNITTTFGANSAIADSGARKSKGFWARLYARMIAARQAQAKRDLDRYLSTLSEADRKDLGWPAPGDRGR